MAHTLNKLTVTQIKYFKDPGRYNDGGGLYLYINKSDQRFWVFRYRDRTTGKHRDMGLGPEYDVTLSEARDKARKHRNTLRDGVDPIDQKKKERADLILSRARQVTFKDCADRYIKAHRASWRNKKHAAQWESTLATYCKNLMPLPVSSIDTALVLQCLEPIWPEKTETATRVRQRIESVLDWATARKYRIGSNPARWRGHLDKLLSKPSKLKNVQHRPALQYHQAGAFMSRLRNVGSMAAYALELQILTATRPGETVNARWSEFDIDRKVWTIPAERMKANKEHTIPISPQALTLLKRLPNSCDFVFPNVSLEKSMTTAAAMKLLKRIEPGITAHGFRSTFRDWAADCTSYPREVIEQAMSHQLKDKAEAAYFRSDMIAKRKRLMADWARFCDIEVKQSAGVTPIRARKSK